MPERKWSPGPGEPDVPDTPELGALAEIVARMSEEDRARFLANLAGFATGQGRAVDSAVPRGSGRRHRARSKPTYYRVRVDLDSSKPPIWRRLDLASSLTLEEVHEVLQVAFSWAGHHLHSFILGGRRWSDESEYFLCEFDVEAGEQEGTPEWQVRLDHVMHDPGDTLTYWYDYGDDWLHTIKLEQVSPRAKDEPLARVVGGRRAAPPDDCGGVWGYQGLLDIIQDPSHPEHASMCEWFESWGGVTSAPDYDPAELDLKELDLDVQATIQPE